jgi:uridylate kinase
MPARRDHVKRDIELFGEAFPEVHEIKDMPRFILREKHRRYFHDPKSNIVIGIIVGGGDPMRTVKAILSGFAHDADDFAKRKAQAKTS